MWHSQLDSVEKIMPVIRIINLEKDTRQWGGGIHGTQWLLVVSLRS